MNTNGLGWTMTAVVVVLLVVSGAILTHAMRSRLAGTRVRGAVVASAGVLGFTLFVLLIWTSVILVAGDPAYGDPLGLLSGAIQRLHLNPARFPILAVLSVVIPGCGLAAWSLSKSAIDMRTHGIRVAGRVTESRWVSARLQGGGTAGGLFPMIAYDDASAASHTIRGSLAWPLSQLRTGDVVEVIYLVRQPEKGVLNAWYELWPPPLFFAAMLLAFLALLRLVLNGSVHG